MESSSTRASRRSRRPRRRTRLSTDQVRSRLYEGALLRFRDQGYDATSVSELTRAAGVAKGTFFNHFPSKEHILASWFRGVWETEARRLARAGIGGGEAVAEQLRRVTQQLEEDPILAGALASRMADLPGDEEPATAGESASLRPLDQLHAWMVDRIRECLPMVVPIHPVSDDDLAALLVGAFVETLREAFLTGDRAFSPAATAKRAGARADFLLASAGLRLP